MRPQDITATALLTVEGELDDISGAGQTRAAHDLCTKIPRERQFHYDVVGAGHYGIFAGRRWRDIVYPEVRDFIKRFDTERFGEAPVPRAVKAQATKAVRKAAAKDVVAVAAAPAKKTRATAQAARKPAARTKASAAAKG